MFELAQPAPRAPHEDDRRVADALDTAHEPRVLDLVVESIRDHVANMRLLTVAKGAEPIAPKQIVDVHVRLDRRDVGASRGEHQAVTVVPSRRRPQLARRGGLKPVGHAGQGDGAR
jgi:hypothetical protein